MFYPRRISLRLILRSRAAAEQIAAAVEKQAKLDPKKTALIICEHVGRSLVQIGFKTRRGKWRSHSIEVVKAARAKGIFIIHAPSSVTGFFTDTPQRKRAQAAPFAKTPADTDNGGTLGTTWCWTDPKHERRTAHR